MPPNNRRLLVDRVRVAAIAAVVLTAVLATASLRASEWVKKTATESWTWLEDYVVVSGTYLVACEPGRECQVGMGIFAFGQPRGEKIRFRGDREITVVGVGAIYVRVTDGRGPAKAAYQPKDSRIIPVAKIVW